MYIFYVILSTFKIIALFILKLFLASAEIKFSFIVLRVKQIVLSVS